jgi:hypothetical protein
MTSAIAEGRGIDFSSGLSRLRDYQEIAGRAIVDSVLQNRGLSFTVMMARQAGKNELSASVELGLLMKLFMEGRDGVKCAPTYRPQALISLSRLWSQLTKRGLASGAIKEDGNAVRYGRARMVFLSAEPAANVVGHTAGIILEVDEAQDVDAEKFDREFRPMAAPYGATIVYYGTPWDDSSLLEQAVQHNLELQRRDGVHRHFQADWTRVAEHNPAYARFVEAERQRLGENHPLFLTQYALKTVPGAGRLFSGTQLAQLQGTHPRQHVARDGETYVAGLDLGGQDWTGSGEGHDATVLTIARVVEAANDAVVREPRLEVVEHLALTGVPHDELIARLADLLGRVWHVGRLAVDATGLGETVARLLQRSLGESIVVPVKFTSESKSRLGYSLIAAVNGGRLRMYAGDASTEYAEFWRQAERARVAYRPSRQMNFYVDPAEGHDDYLVSLALAVHAAGEEIPGPRIARGRAPVGV